MVLPHALMVTMVPRGTLVHPTEGDVPFIAYSRIGYVDPDGGCEWVFLFLAYTRQYSCLVQLSGDTPIVPSCLCRRRLEKASARSSLSQLSPVRRRCDNPDLEAPWLQVSLLV
jgi:hypothetical protein